MENFQGKANFIWQVADDILRGTFKQHEYGDIILHFVVLRRLDCVLEDSKDKVIETHEKFKNKLQDPSQILLKSTGGINFYNTSHYDLRRLSQDAKEIELNFNNYLNNYSANVRDIIENFQIDKIIKRLASNDLLFLLITKFTEIDLHPDKVSNHEMGYIFEELLRRFSEMSNETAGEHYTPREVIRLMVNLLFAEHKEELQGKGLIRTIYDPACGTGGMLTVAREHIASSINPDLDIIMCGQQLNEQTYAIAKSDFLMLGEEEGNIEQGNSFTNDKFKGKQFNYMLCNPPFGVSWKKEQNFINNEANDTYGRFAAGLPRSNDGALLFLQHMISKMEPRGSRIAIIFNGSPLFVGAAGSGESNIRKWIIENDWLEAIIGLPNNLFYNTGIVTYIWIVTNKKPEYRKGKIQLIDAKNYFKLLKKKLGEKRKYISNEQIKEITKIYKTFEDNEVCKIFDNKDFGYTKVTIELPLVKNNKVQFDSKGKPKPDTSQRDYERVPLKENINDYFNREVEPHILESWMDRNKDKIGYEINFTKYFYKYNPPRSLTEISEDLLKIEIESKGLLKEIVKD